MRFRLGLLVGFGVGYVLGAKAGRERYEQIRQQWNALTGSPKFQELTERSKEVAGEAGRKSLHAVQQGVEKASGTVKGRLRGKGDTPSGTGDGELPADVGGY